MMDLTNSNELNTSTETTLMNGAIFQQAPMSQSNLTLVRLSKNMALTNQIREGQIISG
jgi:hypothetical protein